MEKETLQLSDIFNLLNIKSDKDIEIAEKVLNFFIPFLLYMKEGDVLETQMAVLSKLSSDLLHIDNKLTQEEILDFSKKILIKIPM